MNTIDARVEDEGKASWLGNGDPMILSAEGNFTMRSGGKLWIKDEVSSVVDVQTCPLEKLAFPLGFNRHFTAKDGMDNISGIDVLMMMIMVLFIIIVLTVTPI